VGFVPAICLKRLKNIVNRLQKVNRVDSMIELFRAWCI
jgi:hypothetical protein